MWPAGIRLQLLLGRSAPRPAPEAVIDALRSLEVRCSDRERSGFQASFALRRGNAPDYELLARGYFEPPSRFVVVVIGGAAPEVLIDGIITHHQLAASAEPGETLLTVTGEDVSGALDLEERSTTYPNQSDSAIVTQILGRYGQYGIVPEVTTTSDVPLETERIPTQQGTDRELIQRLAADRGFVFFVEPTAVGSNRAYWGPPPRRGAPQPALTAGAGPAANLDTPMQFSFDALAAETPEGVMLQPGSRATVPVSSQANMPQDLAARSVPPLRRTVLRRTPKLGTGDASAAVAARSLSSTEQVTATGEVDTVRYGAVLRARRLVGVRGAGLEYDGVYYVKEVTHILRRGQYRQRFTLVREGRGAQSARVAP